jgi:hypothetical protein
LKKHEKILSKEKNLLLDQILGLTTVASIVAKPGIINAITKVISVAIAQKPDTQLKKEDPKWYEVLEKATDKIR